MDVVDIMDDKEHCIWPLFVWEGGGYTKDTYLNRWKAFFLQVLN